MKWKTRPVGEALRHRKGSITIDDTTSYKLCRVQLHRRGVVLRQHLHGAEINTKKQQVCKAGDFLVAEMDAKVGGYGFVPPELDGAIVSSHYYLFELDASKLHPAFLEVISQAQILQQQIVAKGSTNYSSIRPDSVLAWQIPLPDMEVQKRVARNFETIQAKLASVGKEITHQETLLAKLKQAILQKAIAGKLTADWRAAHPDVEPASQLLHRIQAERARLIAAKKLRPEKPLPKITPAEIPFEIPQGWEWCRIVNATLVIVDCPHSTPQWTDKGMTCAKTGQFRRFHLDLTNRFYVSQQTYEERVERLVPKPDDILYSREGSILGIACRIPAGEELCLGQRMMLLRPHHPTSSAFIELMLNSPHVTKIADESTLGGCAPHINVGEIKAFVIPLPPLAEQAAIVARVEVLMEHCRALAAEIAHTRTHAAHLLQAVLKEAFAPATK